MSLVMSAVITSTGAAAVSAGVLPGAAPASAAPTCVQGYHCVFNQTGARHSFFSSDSNFGDNFFADDSAVNDNIWAAANNGSSVSHYYAGPNSIGFLFCVNPSSQVVFTAPQGASSVLLRQGTSIACY
jgi:hypothetical protein